MILLLVVFTLLASAISANKVILYSLSPEFLVALRMLAGALILASLLYIKTQKLFAWPVLKKYFLVMVSIALFTTFFPSNLKAYALAHMPSSKMAFFGTLDPFVAALYSYFFFNERLTWRQWLGIGFGFTGMMILMGGSSQAEEPLKAFLVFSYPELAAFFAIVLSRLGYIQAQQLLKKDLFSPMQFTVLTTTMGGLCSLAVTFLWGTTTIASLNEHSLPLLQSFPFSSMGGSLQLGLLLSYTILVGNVIGYTLYAHVLKKHSPTFIALTSFMIPLIVQLIGWLFLDESLSVRFFSACVVTFMGVLLFFLDEKMSVVDARS